MSNKILVNVTVFQSEMNHVNCNPLSACMKLMKKLKLLKAGQLSQTGGYRNFRIWSKFNETWVDEVIPDAPWVINQEFLDNNRIDYVAHDSLPYADTSGAGKDVYEFVKKVGRFKETMRTEGISTSDIIMRIVKDYNQYVMRNLDRGYSREDLGVSFEKRLRVNMRLKKLQERVKEQQEKVGEKIQTVKMLRNEWVENADRWVAGFLEIFEEGCHKMGTAIRDSIQERLIKQIPRKKLENGQDDDTDDQFYEEYFDHDMGSEEDEDEKYYDEEEEVEEEEKENAVKTDAKDNK
ncbi:unnamed protein product [Brassica oleracea]